MIERRQFLASAAAAGLAGLSQSGAAKTPQSAGAEVKTGGSRLITIAGGHKVWTKRIGRGDRKVLLLHGGPGFSHDYLECFEDFLPAAGIELYHYDQLGCGNSDRPEDTALWTLPRYLDELEVVRAGLGLETLSLYGHSWGGILGIEYALKHPERLERLVISNMTASIPAYVKHISKIRARLPRADRETLAKYEAMNKTDDPAYLAVIDKIYAEHVLRLPEWPEPVARAFKKLNTTIYAHMQGPNEFAITGNLKDWDRWSDLSKIKAETLVMGARHDEMDPDDIRREGSLIPGAKTWISERGSHLAMYDDQQAYFARLVPFLRGEG